jgi:hypothetical protein
MEIEASIGLGLYVSGVVLLVRTLEEYLPLAKRRIGRWSSIVTLVLLGVLFMLY